MTQLRKQLVVDVVKEVATINGALSLLDKLSIVALFPTATVACGDCFDRSMLATRGVEYG